VIRRPLFIVLGLAMLGALPPAAATAAPASAPREYIVALEVADSDAVIAPSNRSARQRLDRRSERAGAVTDRLADEIGFKTRHRFANAMTGFSARLTPQQAAELAADAKVASIRPARRFRIAAQTVPVGIERVKALQTGGGSADVDADVAVLDTGIGPKDGNGDPLPMGPAGKPELNIAGGINCFDDPWTERNEAELHPGHWADSHWHGTHVAGTIGARDNDVGTIGVAPGARLWAVRVFEGSRGTEGSIVCGLDWAIATWADPGQPDIDVINMSIQGPRIDQHEDCDEVLDDPFGDPIQQGVCRATAIGISVVAAAGNQGYDANLSSPGGYDQVISVGAMSDFDGAGWGAAGNDGCAPGERDDTYASYSNFGRDIDIVAPGTCVASTYPDASGDAIADSSGTSMAAPHVTGAVARYLADNPGTSTERMRRLVRAAGRMDWEARSDPHWSGIDDLDAPNRVLDVRALTGPEMLRSWVYHASFKVSGTSTTRNTRVDVQRGGGYAGMANLDLTGLPGAVGSHRFENDSLSGLTGLGTNLRLDLELDGPEDEYDLGVVVNGPGVSPFSRGLALTVDRSGPVIRDLAPRIRDSKALLSQQGAAQTYLRWDASDAVSSVAKVRLQRKIGTGAWRDAGTSGASSALVTLKPGQANKFRVKAADSLGNGSTSDVATARLSIRDSESAQWFQPATGDWRTQPATKAYGGSLLLAKGATESLATSFRGKAVALAGAVGPGRGSFRVRIDEGAWTTVSLKTKKAGQRRVVWSRELQGGPHSVEVQGLSGQSALDAILIVR
jgi:subtilisin family serine protease